MDELEALKCACNCGETSASHAGQFAGGEWYCSKICMNEAAEKQSYDDLIASGGIADAP